MKEEWLEKRKHGIGGSDIGVITGHSSLKSPYDLFLEKTQNIIEPENFNMRRGSSLEPTIIKSYLQATGDQLVNHRNTDKHIMSDAISINESPMMFESRSNPIKKGSPDGLILSDDPHKGMGVLEVKAPSSQVFRKISREGLPGSWNDQVQWYMNILGLKWAAVAVFSAEYWEFQFFTVEADLEYQGELIKAAMLFWECIVTNTPPNVELNEPETGFKGKVVKVNSMVWYEAGEEYFIAKEAAAQATAKLNKIKGRIKKIVGGSYCTEGNNMRVFKKPFRVYRI